MNRIAIVVSSVLALLISITTAHAYRSTDPSTPLSGYDLSWYTIDGGGATFSTGSSYSLGGTIGQPDAGLMAGGSYVLSGGFWVTSLSAHNMYLPLTLK